jgi:hypothetical protein
MNTETNQRTQPQVHGSQRQTVQAHMYKPKVQFRTFVVFS